MSLVGVQACAQARSMVARRSVRACLQAAGSGLLARNAARARSIALSTVCHSAGARGFSEGSASSQDVSRSLIRAFAAARSPLSTRDDVSTMMVRNAERSPSLDAAAVSADGAIRTAGAAAPVASAASPNSAKTPITGIGFRLLIVYSHFVFATLRTGRPLG